MAIREELVASATQFLQDPSVATSSVDNRIAFLRTKNLTQEEIDAALSRASAATAPTYTQGAPTSAPPQPSYPPYPQYAWQPQPVAPPVPRRDWRDWFIMATVMGGLSYGLYTVTKRYVAPLIAPPTPERLEQDKQTIQEQFDRAFALVEQLAKDTEALKAAEQERTQRLDGALAELENAVAELRSSNRRREDEATRLRDDLYALKDSIPDAMEAQKAVVDGRLKEVNSELSSLKMLLAQRILAPSAGSPPGAHLRPTSGNAAPSSASAPRGVGSENEPAEPALAGGVEAAKQSSVQGRASPLGGTSTGKASIPAWQLAMSNKTASGTTNGAAPEAEGSSQSAKTSS